MATELNPEATAELARMRSLRLRRLVVVLAGLLLTIAGAARHSGALAMVGLLVVLSANLLFGGT